MLAGDLVAFWRADTLNDGNTAGEPVATWTDSVGGLEAVASGQPVLQKSVWSGRSVVRFDGADGADSFRVAADSHPMSGADDFTVAVAFATLFPGLKGNTGRWFDNTGLVDSNHLGFAADWGVGFSQAGQVSAGMGVGFGEPVSSVYSAQTGLNDGQIHLITFTRDGSTMSLYVDDGEASRVMDADTAARESIDMTFGILQTDMNPLTGDLAEVRIYDGVLDDAAVAELYGEVRAYYRNTAPVASDDSYSLTEDPSFGFQSIKTVDGVLQNDSDVEGDALSAVLVSGPTHGAVTLRLDGSFVYSPEPDFFGTDTFSYTAHDAQSSNIAHVTLNVINAYDPPVPMADRYKILPTQTLTVAADQGVLANDQNPDRVALTVALSDDVSAGALTLSDDGSFAYNPQGFSGSTTFTYRVDDGTQWSAPVAVTLLVNTPPVSQTDRYDLSEDLPVSVPASEGVLANDVDADGNMLTATLVAEPLHGALQFQEDGSFTYVPQADYFGPDEFRYSITDGVDHTSETTVLLNIVSVNDLPEAADDYYLTLPLVQLNVPSSQGVLTNDRDTETQLLQAVPLELPSHGTLRLEQDGAFSYVPDAGYSGTDSFRYRVNDTIDLSPPATVRVRVDSQPVLISEFMAANVNTLLTRTRETAEESFRRGTEEAFDWLELQNPSDMPLAIGGLFLTDDPQDPSKWTIPAGTMIAPHGELVIFASGRDVYDPALDELGLLHTNFKLDSDGEYLAITAPGDVALFAFAPTYPKQRPNISYGLDAADQRRFFPDPTPGADNGQGLAGVVADTQFSVDRGFFDQPQQLAITTNTPGADIYYTTDGSEPDPLNPSARRYTQPLTIETTTTLRAAGFHDSLLPSNVDTQTYIFPDQVLTQGNGPEGYPSRWRASNGTLPADYEMDPEITQHPAYRDIMDEALLSIPTISIVTAIDNLFHPQTGIYMYPTNDGVNWERPTSVELIYPDGTAGFQIDAGLRIQGGASRLPEKSPKHSFRLLFRDSYGASKLEYPLFGTEAADAFDTLILRAGFNQSYIHHNTFLGNNRGRAQYVRDQWAKDTQLAMGRPAAHNSYAHVYINGMYWGLYNPTERPANGFAESYLGGSKEQYDVLNSGDLIDGDRQAWSELTRRSRANLSDQANYDAVAEMLDIDAFIDYMLINHYGGNMDWDSHNWYALRQRVDGGKFLFFMWDSEFLFIGNRDNRIRIQDAAPGQWFDRLTDNEEFRVKLSDAIQKHMFYDGLLTPEKVIERWNARSDQITDAIVAESARWGDYRRDVHQSGSPLELLERDVQWVAERDRLLNDYFPQRTDVVIEQYRNRNLFPAIDAPLFSQRGGTISRDHEISLQAENEAKIYYTLDGTDPRAAGGEVHSNALRYDGPFQLTDSTTVTVRALSVEAEWSALDRVRFLYDAVPASADHLRIAEIHYNPASPSPDELAAGHDNNDDFEFIELVNVSSQRIDLSHVSLERSIVDDEAVGVQFDFASGSVTQLDPGQRVLVVEDTEAFAFRYADDLPVAGRWSGRLSNSGEQITLSANGVAVQQFAYSDRWYSTTDGGGSSLEHVDPAQVDLDSWGQPGSWRASGQVGGTPGVGPTVAVPGDANGDGIFNSEDLVMVFQAGEYEDGVPNNSIFDDGDWNGDGDFDSSDLVFVFQAGHFSAAAKPTVSEVAAAVDWLFGNDPFGARRRVYVP